MLRGCYITQETNLALSDDLEGWVWGSGGDSGGREHIYNYDWCALLYGKNQHNILKQFSSNWNQILKRERLGFIQGHPDRQWLTGNQIWLFISYAIF